MARSDLLINLVEAGSAGDARLMKSTVEAIIAEERSKQHNVLADRLTKAMNGGPHPGAPPARAERAQAAQRGRDFIDEIRPRRRLADLMLPDPVRAACEQFVEEHLRGEVLRAHSLEPRHRMLLVGPPGNGKTTLAEAIAEALALPMFAVRYELMIGSYLGETASRMKRLFDYVRTTPCVLFFDEFDVLGKERGDVQEMGEIKRVVSGLLLQIDDLPSYAVAVAATNHSELLDRAVWRRFQLRMELPKPTRRQMANYVSMFLGRFDEPAGMSAESLAKRLGSVAYSEAEEFCLNLIRRHVLAAGERPLKSILAEQLKLWADRVNGPESSKGGIDDAGTAAA